jgi:diguanylate cyclase (GGDEF)-like protein
MAELKSWNVWQLPKRAQFVVVVVDLAAVVALVAAARTRPVRPSELIAFGLLLAGAALSTEVYRRVGSTHRGADRAFHEMATVFIVAGALVLPPLLAMLLVIPVQAVLQMRSARLPVVKRLFNASHTMLGCLAAATVREALAPGGLPGLGHLASVTGTGSVSLVAGGLTFMVVTEGLLVVLLHEVSPATPWRAHLGDAETLALNSVDIVAAVTLTVLWVVAPTLFILAIAPVLLLQRSVVHRHLVEATRTDTKTGVANLGWWREVAGRAVTRAQHGTGSVSVLMVDLDHFKRINDTYGHLAGDQVLTAVADTLRLSVRPGDLVGRFGGEEFAVLLHDAGFDQAVDAARRIHDRIGLVGRRTGSPDDLAHVTASIGVATFAAHGVDLDELVAAADCALYEAKTSGRDRIATARSVTPTTFRSVPMTADLPVRLPSDQALEVPTL